jgi:transmembrane sensor
MWTRIQEYDVSRPHVVRRNWSLAFAACVLLVGVLLVWRFDGWSTAAAPLAFADSDQLSVGQRLTANDEGRTLAFEEGSQIRMAPQSELSVVSNDGSNLVFSLRRGQANFSVTPGGPRRWTVDAGSVVVRVVGTVFSVERGASGTRVAVIEGIVSASGSIPGGSVQLGAGQSVESLAPPRAPAEQTEQTEQRSPSSSGKKSDRVFSLDDLEPREEVGSTHDEGRPSSRAVDDAGDVVARLLRDADQHRRQGRLGQAAAALRAAVRVGPPSDPRRALAALSYARLNLNPSEVAEVLSMTIDTMPPSLREPALSRLVQALRQSGQEAAAHSWQRTYLAEFPSGPRAEQFRAPED